MSGVRGWTLATVLGALAVGGAAAVVAQGRFDKIAVTNQDLGGSVHVLTGAGGNIGVCAGPDGVLLVDDQYAEMSPKVLAAVKAIDERPLRWVLNTHWHGDHTGGNANMASAGATLLAQDAVRARMRAGQNNELFKRVVPPAAAEALPVVTFSDSLTLYLNGDTLQAFHVAPAHTDGDVVVRFVAADVVHMGDCLFQGMYPVIDLPSGGSIDGMIAASERVLPVIGPATKVIPGHGPVTDRAGVIAYRDMLKGVRAAVAEHVRKGHTLEQTVAAKPTQAWDAQWGGGFIKPDDFAGIVWRDLSARTRR